MKNVTCFLLFSLFLISCSKNSKVIGIESGWECGVGVDKDKFKCILVYDD